MDIAAWLRELGLERYEEAFRENEIDAEILPKLTTDDLKDMGVAVVGHRRKLLEAIAALAEPDSAPQPEPSALAEAAPRAWPAEAERRQLTVLFCDLVGSTELSARLDPEDMGVVIHAYQACCAEVVRRWDGHVAKYMGDGVLVYFGYPQAHEDDPERAIRAGLDLTAAVARLTAGNDIALAARIGIATGLVMVGDLIGEGAAQEEVVVGETPNLAARLEALADPGTVAVAPSTRQLVGGLFELADLGEHVLKGFAEPVRAWRVSGEARPETRFEARIGTLTPLVGREHELGLLQERFAFAQDGDGQVVLIEGEAGIGKSRLTRALLNTLENEPHTRLRYQCSPYHTNSAFYPVLQQLERAADFSRNDSENAKLDKLEAALQQAREDVTEAASLLAPLLGIDTGKRYPPLVMTPQRQKQRTLEVWVELVESLAMRQPVLLILEDAHWLDPTSRELFTFAVPRLTACPVLLLITFRPEFEQPWSGYGHVTHLSLNRLGRRQASGLAESLAGGKSLPSEVLDQIVAKTDGVPLFVEELTKNILESKLLTDKEGRYELTEQLPLLAIPATLHDSLIARLDRLAPVKEVAQTAAVIGREFSYPHLAAVTLLPEPELVAALDQLVEAELIFQRGAPPEATYTFKHALVCDVAYQSLLKSRLRQLHARIGEVLGDQDTAPEVLAYHLTEAGLIDQAVPQWLAAGERALHQSAYQEALGHLHQGLSLVEQLPPSATRTHAELRFQVAMGQALLPLRGPVAETETAFERARQLSTEANEPREWFRATFGQWYCNYFHMNVPQVRALSQELLASTTEAEDTELALQAHHAAWSSSWPQGLLSEARHHAETGLQLYDPESHHAATGFYAGHDAGVCCRYTSAIALVLLGYPDQALAAVDEALDLARQLKHPFTTVICLTFASIVHQLRRDPVRARACARDAIALCTEQSIPVHLAANRIIDTWARRELDDAPDVEQEIADGIKTLRDLGAHLRRPYYLGLYSEVCHARGTLSPALEAVSDATELAQTGGERWYQAELYRLRGELELSKSPADRSLATASFEQALDVARNQQAKWLELRAARSLAQLWSEQGERQRAFDILSPVYGRFTEGFDTPDLKDAKVLLDELALPSP